MKLITQDITEAYHKSIITTRQDRLRYIHYLAPNLHDTIQTLIRIGNPIHNTDNNDRIT